MKTPSLRRLAFTSIFLNIVLALLKWTTGILGGSFALIADAIESTSDIAASVMVFIGIKISQKPADTAHPYGHGKVEILIAFFVVGFLCICGTVIAFQSIINIQTPHPSPKPWTLWIIGGIVLFKEMSYRYLNRHANHSSALKAEAWHHRSDAATSVAAFVGISIACIMGPAYASADDWMALLSSLFIFYNAYLIFSPALGEMMDKQAYHDMVETIRTMSMTVPDVIQTEKCYIRKSGAHYFVDLHIQVDGHLSVSKGHDIAHRLKNTLQDTLPFIKDVLIHVEPV